MNMWKGKIPGANGNGDPEGIPPEITLNKQSIKELEIILDKVAQRVDLVTNAARSMGREFHQRLVDRRRNYEKECGHPESSSLSPEVYQELYDRNEIAARVVEVWSKECWQNNPCAYDDEDESVETPFEKSWKEMVSSLLGSNYHKQEEGSVIWEYLQRLDIQCGIGRYAVLYMAFDDGITNGIDPRYPVKGWNVPDSEADYEDPSSSEGRPYNTFPSYEGPLDQRVNVTNPERITSSFNPGPSTEGQAFRPRLKLIYLQVYPESMAKIVKWETNRAHPRYGQPVQYMLNTGIPGTESDGPSKGMVVHWSRVIHVADNVTSNKVMGMPRCQQVLNRILDLKKLYGGSAEMYWLGALPAIIFKTDPALGGDVDLNLTALKDQIERLMNGLQRYASLNGMDATALAPTVVDPSPQIDKHLEAICIKIEVAVRIFKGSERGELSSSQDSVQHSKKIRARNNRFTTPCIILPFITRLIDLGVLAPPKKEGIKIYWPDPDAQSPQEKANVATTLIQALVTYTQGDARLIVPPNYLLTHILGGFFTRAEANTILEEAEKQARKYEKKQMKKEKQLADEQFQRDLEMEKQKQAGRKQSMGQRNQREIFSRNSADTSSGNILLDEKSLSLVINQQKDLLTALVNTQTAALSQDKERPPINIYNQLPTPTITVNNQPPNVHVASAMQEPPIVNVNIPQQQPPTVLVEPTINVETAPVTNQINVQPATITDVRLVQDKPLDVKVEQIIPQREIEFEHDEEGVPTKAVIKTKKNGE